ncbi:N-formylglutamate amidohydrolase [Methylomonas sp. AM2-LC]|uniref:N-formylglutamate amidohydrolase n=1 Tax=Methylomonas sp. AM2-LC TaxID=3153301 RepID=UPI00326627D3
MSIGETNLQGLVITCEHGGNNIPTPYQELFQDQELLDSHRGFDAGALSMARALAIAFSAPLVSSTISRLLVDLNRSIGNPSLHAKAIHKLPTDKRKQILREYYQPYRTDAEQAIRQVIAKHGQVIHLSSHSFTPVLNGKERRADIGLLYDPMRVGETTLCKHWQADLKAHNPELIIRRNYPYAGKGDGLTTWLRSQLPSAIYMGIELEINQKYIINAGQHWTTLRKVIIASLARVLVNEHALNI